MEDQLNILTGTYGSGNPYLGGRRIVRWRDPLKRKPSGSKPCKCGRRISANKQSCLKCSKARK